MWQQESGAGGGVPPGAADDVLCWLRFSLFLPLSLGLSYAHSSLSVWVSLSIFLSDWSSGPLCCLLWPFPSYLQEQKAQLGPNPQSRLSELAVPGREPALLPSEAGGRSQTGSASVLCSHMVICVISPLSDQGPGPESPFPGQ